MKKHLTIKHYCEKCFNAIRYDCESAKPLLKHQLIANVPRDYSISELSKIVKQNINQQTCKKHPNSKTFVRFSFYHEETIII